MRFRAQPIATAGSARLDDALSAGFVRLLNAGQEDADSGDGLYNPKPGDFAVGVVVSVTEARLDVAVGADRLATLLAKELLQLHRAEMPAGGAEAAPPRPGSVGIVAAPALDEEAQKQKRGGRALVAPGTVVFAEVLGRTLSGRPLLSARRLFRRFAWHRARQIMQLDEPIEVKIYEWNTGGLLTRIEGLRAFLPKVELMARINTFTDVKNNVGRTLRVCITRLDEETNALVISEKKAWEMTYLKEGTLLQGKVRKIFPYGAQVRINGTNRSGLLHVSNISRGRVVSVSDILKIDEEVKVLVVKSNVPDKIALSITDLESAPGLFLSDKEPLKINLVFGRPFLFVGYRPFLETCLEDDPTQTGVADPEFFGADLFYDYEDPSLAENYPEWDEGQAGAEEVTGGEGAGYKEQDKMGTLFGEWDEQMTDGAGQASEGT